MGAALKKYKVSHKKTNSRTESNEIIEETRPGTIVNEKDINETIPTATIIRNEDIDDTKDIKIASATIISNNTIIKNNKSVKIYFPAINKCLDKNLELSTDGDLFTMEYLSHVINNDDCKFRESFHLKNVDNKYIEWNLKEYKNNSKQEKYSVVLQLDNLARKPMIFAEMDNILEVKYNLYAYNKPMTTEHEENLYCLTCDEEENTVFISQQDLDDDFETCKYLIDILEFSNNTYTRLVERVCLDDNVLLYHLDNTNNRLENKIITPSAPRLLYDVRYRHKYSQFYKYLNPYDEYLNPLDKYLNKHSFNSFSNRDSNNYFGKNSFKFY